MQKWEKLATARSQILGLNITSECPQYWLQIEHNIVHEPTQFSPLSAL